MGFACQFVDRIDAEEIVNDVFLKAGEHIDASLGEQSIRGFLYTVTKNLCYERLRKKQLFTVPLTDDLVVPETTPESLHQENAAAVSAVKESIQRLPQRSQALFEMRFGARMTEREIAAVLQVKEGTVSSMIHRLKASIAKALVI